ncbi:unnamed protein product [Brachionus calyciflorus]|uniref:Uncharacterized protein n=1 Tax=Brachionus calyciflorus TaxID=104777 RepID=A0A813Z846_9BILA|nr:unnamed protein product [Brachionus calyciflorus]
MTESITDPMDLEASVSTVIKETSRAASCAIPKILEAVKISEVLKSIQEDIKLIKENQLKTNENIES